MKTSHILFRARDIIEKFGLTKHTTWDKNGFCVMGAVQETTMVTDEYLCAMSAIREKIVEIYPEAAKKRALVPAWNDDPLRTKQEVLDMLEKAAIGCLERGE